MTPAVRDRLRADAEDAEAAAKAIRFAWIEDPAHIALWRELGHELAWVARRARARLAADAAQ